MTGKRIDLAREGVRLGRRPILCAWCDEMATHTVTIDGGGREWSCPRHKGFLADYGRNVRRIGG